jgi:hypothetical protein
MTPMANDTWKFGVDESHFRSVAVTSLAALAGIAAGVLSAMQVGVAPEAATDLMGLYIFAGMTLVQYPLLYGLGIDVEEFSTKDHLFVAFMTFSMWFVTWGILLTAGTPI